MDIPNFGHSVEHGTLNTSVQTRMSAGNGRRLSVETQVADGEPGPTIIYQPGATRIEVNAEALTGIAEHFHEHLETVRRVVDRHKAGLTALGTDWAVDTADRDEQGA